MGYSIHWVVFAGYLLCILPANALTFEVSEDETGMQSVYMSGSVEFGDEQKFEAIMAEYPDISTVVLGESPGGNLFAGIEIANTIYNYDVVLDVQGPAGSAATIIALGAKHRLTYWVGGAGNALPARMMFHCAYKKGNDFCDENATREASQKLSRFTGIPADTWYKDLMETTPATYFEVSLDEVIERTDWKCEYSGYAHCYRGEYLEGGLNDRSVLYNEYARLAYGDGETMNMGNWVFSGEGQSFSPGISEGSSVVGFGDTTAEIRFSSFYLEGADLAGCSYYFYAQADGLNEGKSIEEIAISISGSTARWDSERSVIVVSGAGIVWPDSLAEIGDRSNVHLFFDGTDTVLVPQSREAGPEQAELLVKLAKVCKELGW